MRKQIETSGATAFKFPIMAAATPRNVVRTNAFRGSPSFEIFAKNPRNGTIPSAAIAYHIQSTKHVPQSYLDY